MSDNGTPRSGLHPHYCNICEGDWDHAELCEEGTVACCPWCLPMADAAPAPGARRGPHFHFCPECTQSWQHRAVCAAPLRVVLPECTGCRTGARERPIEFAPAPRLPLSRRERVRRARLIRKLAGPAAIAASVIVAISLVLVARSFFVNRQAPIVARVSEPDVVAIPPIPLPQPLARVEELPLPVAEQARLQREGERREGQPAPAPAPIVAPSAPPSEGAAAPKSAGPTHPSGPAGTEEPRVALAPSPPPPAPALPRDAAPESQPRQAEPPTPPTESWTPTGPVVGAVPGALSQGGGAALDTLMPGPRPVVTAPQRQDAADMSSESPRWSRSTISAVMRAVVDIRPSQRRELQPPPSRGFIVDELGHVLTTDLRLADSGVLEVTLADGRTLGATVVARDRANHIAILRLARRGVPSIPLGDSGALAVGERVLAIGGGIGSDGAPVAATVLATGAATGGNLAIDLMPTPDGVGGPILNQLGAAVGILLDGAPPADAQRKLTFGVPIDRVKTLLRDAQPRSRADLLNVPEGR